MPFQDGSSLARQYYTIKRAIIRQTGRVGLEGISMRLTMQAHSYIVTGGILKYGEISEERRKCPLYGKCSQ